MESGTDDERKKEKMPDKWIVTFPIGGHECNEITGLMDAVSSITGEAPPYASGLGAHISFHRPVVGVSEDRMRELIFDAVLQMRQTRATVSNLYSFGKEYVVMPVHATLALAGLWVSVNDLLVGLPGYEPGPYDPENTLHITIARHTSKVFDRAWPQICRLPVPTLTFRVKRIALYRKRSDNWSMVDSVDMLQ